MKGSIPRTFIDDILTKTNIVDLINSRWKKPAVIIKPVARLTMKKHLLLPWVIKSSFIIALVAVRTAMPFPF